MDEKNYKEDVGLLDDSFQYDPPRLPTVNRWPYQRAILFAMAIGLLLSTCLNLFLLFRVFTDPGQHSYGFKFPEAFYSPISSLLTYHPRLFTTGLSTETSIYVGPPSPSKTKAWENLYDIPLQIPTSSADKLNNKTIPSPLDPDEYIIGINVFHYLHCLHMLSDTIDFLYHGSTHFNLTPTYNPFDGVHSIKDFTRQYPYLGTVHSDHCIDILRQALMCNADVSTFVYQPATSESSFVGARVDTVHMCADFGVLREWAREHVYHGGFVGVDEGEMRGRCGPRDQGCGEEFGEGEWRERNRWVDGEG